MTTTATFFYADPATIVNSDDKPCTKVDTDWSSFGRTARKRSVHDIRSAAAADPHGGWDINSAGFALYHAKAHETEFVDDTAVRTGYYHDIEQLLREKLSTPAEPVRRVVIFDHTIRRRNVQAPRQPVRQVHVDQTPQAAETRVRRHVVAEDGDDRNVADLLRGRYQIINVWRPIGYAASDYPLALVDWRTTSPADLVAVDLLYPNRPCDDGDDRGKEVLPDPDKVPLRDGYSVKGETYTVIPNDQHKFYYAKDMTPDEAMFIKCFDSRSAVHANGRPGVAAYTPHTAFEDPNTPPDAKGRQSIEVRCLVFYGDGSA